MPRARARPRKATVTATGENKPTVLVVEDSPTQAEALVATLEDDGYDATLARDGETAVRILQERGFDLVISDIVMPGEVDGYELCRRIKAGPHRDTPVVLLTSLSDPMDIIHGLEAGADNFLTKPYAPEHLLERLAVLLTTRRARARGRVRAGVTVYFMGRQFTVTSEREQILDLLVSTFEDAVRQNHELREREAALARSQKTLAGLYGIAVALNGCTTEAEVAETALEKAMELPGVRAGWLNLREGETGFRVVATRNLPPALRAPEALQGDCLCQRKLLAGELDQVTNILECERLQQARGETRGLRYHATVPLWIRDRTVGVLNLVAAEQGLFSDDDRTILYGVGNQIATALERARLREHLEHLVDQRTAALTAEIAERRRAEESLRLSDSILNQIGNLVLVADSNGLIRYASPSVRTVLGYDPEDVMGDAWWTLSREDPDERAREKAAAVRVARGEVPPPAEPYERAVRARDGSLRWILWNDSKGPGDFVIGVGYDVTERKTLEEQFRQAQKMEAVG
ncbi:MAG: response regulator, partial [Gemmatimonadetes bacterium]|nr:response regulator [Gemmatimonadota bacterium]